MDIGGEKEEEEEEREHLTSHLMTSCSDNL
jgi:hypothetical protein